MKIMIVAPYFSPKIGGLETYALNVAKGLKANGNDVFVVTSNADAKQRVEEEVQGLRVIRLPISLKLSNTPINPAWYFQIRAIVKAEKPDIIDAHSPVPFIADMAYLARGNAKFVMTYHAGSLKKGGGLIDTALGIYEQTALKGILKKADAVIGVYPDFVTRLTGGSVPVNFIPPGVDTTVFTPKAKSSTSKKRQTIVFVGRIERSSAWKGIATLVRAMSEVCKTYPNAVLQLVGDGDAVDDYKQQADELGLAKNLVCSGSIRGRALVDILHAADMLVLPSETDAEAFGTVLIEAMACGLPVIGSKIGGIPNVIQDNVNGLLVPPGDDKALAASIVSLLGDPTRSKKLAEHGIDTVQSNFSVKRLVAKTQHVLETL